MVPSTLAGSAEIGSGEPTAGSQAAAGNPPGQADGALAVVSVRGVGNLEPGLVGALGELAGVDAFAAVRAGQALLTGSRDASGRPVDAPAPGWAVPVQVVAVEPDAYAALLRPAERAAISGLRPGQALLGATSARVRGLGAGAVVTLSGRELAVAGVVDDGLVGAAEVVVRAEDGPALGAGDVRYALAGTAGDPAALQARLDAALAGRDRVRTRALGRSPWAPWREVLPQAVVKERFGEFALRTEEGRDIEMEPAWVEANLVAASVPILGRVRCHRAMVPALAAALGELEAAGLGSLVDPADYAGCFSPRLIAPGGDVSRHAWGLAVDLNAAANPYGSHAAQDPRLVAIMERHGFGYGGRWPTPDPMHFEFKGS